MRKNFGVKTAICPQPALVIGTYNADGTPNAMLAAWGGLSAPDEVTLEITGTHKTAENLTAKGAFTISMATVECVAACDYIGIASGNEVADKVAAAGFHTTKSEFVDAPLIDELPLAIECKVREYIPEKGHLVGEIVNVSIDESILIGGDYKLDMAKFRPIVFEESNAKYFALGECVGTAWEIGTTI